MPGTLVVTCPEYLEEVRSFADKTNQREALEKKLSELTQCLQDNWTVELYTDFAEQSFMWSEFGPNRHRGLTGGLIYHGLHDGGGNGQTPTFSVNLTPISGWAIHT